MNEKKGLYEFWNKNSDEKVKIENKLETFITGRDDSLEEDMKEHEIIRGDKKEEQEVMESESTWRGVELEEIVKNKLEKLEFQLDEIKFLFTKNKKQFDNLVKKDIILGKKLKELVKNNPNGGNEQELMESNNLLKNMLEELDRLAEINKETKKILLDREDKFLERISIIEEKYKNIMNIINPVHPELN